MCGEHLNTKGQGTPRGVMLKMGGPNKGASLMFHSSFQMGLRLSKKALSPSIASWVFMTFSR